MAITAALISGGLGLAGALGSAAITGSRTQQKQQEDQTLQYAALQQAAANQQNQALVQAMINQRGVAGQTDSFGNQIAYDPATNTWRTTLGPLPLQAQTAAQQAAIARNTTDLRAAQFANQQAALRATQAGPAADTALRNLQTFRPMPQDALVGLLQQQATNAQQATFRPMIADTLRQFARTGTAAGPVLGQIGRDEAQNLRNSLIDAQIKGMAGVGDINNQRLQGLQTNATTTASLANPSLQFSGLSGSGADNTLAQVVAQRAGSSAITPAYGMAGSNTATKDLMGAFGTAGASLADPNYRLNQMDSVVKQLTSATQPGGPADKLINALFNNNKNTGNSADQSSGTYYPSGSFYNPPAQPGGKNVDY